MLVDIQIGNMEFFKQSLKGLPADMRRKAIQPVMREAGNIAKREQKNLLRGYIASNPNSESTGTLNNALRSVTVRQAKSGPNKVEILIGVVRKSGPVLAPSLSKKGGRPFYWIYFEKGYHHKGRFYRGKPFVGLSVKNRESEIVAAIERGINRYVMTTQRNQQIRSNMQNPVYLAEAL